jgi:hypothetical protein
MKAQLKVQVLLDVLSSNNKSKMRKVVAKTDLVKSVEIGTTSN